MEDVYDIRLVPDATAPESGFPLNHPYLEVVYGPLLGPTAVLLARALGRALQRAGGPTDVDLRQLARDLGLQSTGNQVPGERSPLSRAFRRLAHVRLTRSEEGGVVAVVVAVPPVSPRVLDGLPTAARAAHFEFLADLSPSAGIPLVRDAALAE